MNSLLSLVFVALVVLAACTVEGKPSRHRGHGHGGHGQGGGRHRSSSSSESVESSESSESTESTESVESAESSESAELEHMVQACQLSDTEGNLLNSSDCPVNSTCDFPSASGMTFTFGGSIVPPVSRQIVFCSGEEFNATTITDKLSEHSCEAGTTTCKDGSTCSFQITVGDVVVYKCRAPENFDELSQIFPHHGRGGHSGSSSNESD